MKLLRYQSTVASSAARKGVARNPKGVSRARPSEMNGSSNSYIISNIGIEPAQNPQDQPGSGFGAGGDAGCLPDHGDDLSGGGRFVAWNVPGSSPRRRFVTGEHHGSGNVADLGIGVRKVWITDYLGGLAIENTCEDPVTER